MSRQNATIVSVVSGRAMNYGQRRRAQTCNELACGANFNLTITKTGGSKIPRAIGRGEVSCRYYLIIVGQQILLLVHVSMSPFQPWASVQAIKATTPAKINVRIRDALYVREGTLQGKHHGNLVVARSPHYGPPRFYALFSCQKKLFLRLDGKTFRLTVTRLCKEESIKF